MDDVKVVVMCRDGAASPQLRREQLSAHRDYVDSHASVLVLSGPLVGDDGQDRTGQFYVLDVPELETARRFVDDDPFTRAGIFAEVTVEEFITVFRDGARV
jgi:uncharacterized protein YciI